MTMLGWASLTYRSMRPKAATASWAPSGKRRLSSENGWQGGVMTHTSQGCHAPSATSSAFTERAEQRQREAAASAAANCVEGTLDVTYWDLLPRVPAPEALAAAKLGMVLFETASEEERAELPGTLPWLLFSPTTRDGSPNSVFSEMQAFASGERNPQTGFAYPH